MKKGFLLIIICLTLFLSACGNQAAQNTDGNDKKEVSTQETQSEENQGDQKDNSSPNKPNETQKAENGTQKPNTSDATQKVPEQSAEDTVLSRKHIMLLKEQMSGAFDTNKMTFAFDRSKTVEGVGCRVYSMQMPGNQNPDQIVYFAVVPDESAIYQYDSISKRFTKVYSGS